MSRQRTRNERTCIGCRCTAPRTGLVRLVVDPDTGTVVVDERRRLPGRGAHVHPDPQCVARALRRRAVTRALRNPDADTSALSAMISTYAKGDESA